MPGQIEALSEQDRAGYYRHLENDRLALSVLDIARMEGKDEGLKEGEQLGLQKAAIETAQKMKEKGFDLQTIAELTGRSMTEIDRL